MRKTASVFLLVAIFLTLCSCSSPEKSIIGTWKSQSTILGVVTETTYTFKDDGTGIKTNVLNVNFSYSFEGDKILITTSVLGIETTEKYSYDFNGDKLVLIGENDTIILEKVK